VLQEDAETANPGGGERFLKSVKPKGRGEGASLRPKQNRATAAHGKPQAIARSRRGHGTKVFR